MKTIPRLLVPIFLVLVAAACGVQQSSTGGDLEVTGRYYELQVTHTLSTVGVFADGAWTESDFQSVESGRRFLLNFTSDGENFELQSMTDDLSFSGHADATLPTPTDVSTNDCLSYAIDEGSFTGGRLVIWRATTGLRAELTLYGSGLPVIGSDRGDLQEVAV